LTFFILTKISVSSGGFESLSEGFEFHRNMEGVRDTGGGQALLSHYLWSLLWQNGSQTWALNLRFVLGQGGGNIRNGGWAAFSGTETPWANVCVTKLVFGISVTSLENKLNVKLTARCPALPEQPWCRSPEAIGGCELPSGLGAVVWPYSPRTGEGGETW